MNVTFYNDQDKLDLPLAYVEELARIVFTTAGVSFPDEVIIHLVDKKTISQLHADFFDDPTPTDCISFPMDDSEDSEDTGYVLLGEIFVCPEVAIEYVKENGGHPIQETSLYIIHGLLHLLGFDDIEDDDRKEMRRMEALVLTNALSKSPLPSLIQNI